MTAEKRQYRNKTQSRENKTVYPPLSVIFTNSSVEKNPDKPAWLGGSGKVDSLPSMAWGSSCGSAQNEYTQNNVGGGTRDKTSTKIHKLLLCSRSQG